MENFSEIHSEEDLKRKAEETILRMNNIRREYSEIIEHTLEFDDRIPWERMKRRDEFDDFRYNGRKPIPPKEEKKSFFSFLDKTEERKKEYLAGLEDYQRAKNTALAEYLEKLEKFDDERISYNSDLEYLKYYFEKSEKSAVEEYAYLVLGRSRYPESLKMNYHAEYNKELKCLSVSYLFPSLNEFPNTQGYRYVPEKRKIQWIAVPYEQALEFYDRTILAVCLRTLHELFEGVYTDAVESVIFNGYVRNGATKIPAGRVNADFNDAFRHNVRCVFGVKTDRGQFAELPLNGRKAEKTLELLQLKRVKNFHDAIQLMAPITVNEL